MDMIKMVRDGKVVLSCPIIVHDPESAEEFLIDMLPQVQDALGNIGLQTVLRAIISATKQEAQGDSVGVYLTWNTQPQPPQSQPQGFDHRGQPPADWSPHSN